MLKVGPENYAKNINKPLTYKFIIKIIALILLITIFIYAKEYLQELFDNETVLSLGYVFISGLWSWQIQSAWHENTKYNKSL